MRKRRGRTGAFVLLGLVCAVLVISLSYTPRAIARDLRNQLARRVEGEPSGATAASVVGGRIRFTVERGQTSNQIAAALERAGVVSSRADVRVQLALTGAANELRAGCYVFAPRTPAAEVVRRLRQGITEEALVSIPEGLRNEEIGKRLRDAGLVPDDAAWQAALASAQERADRDGGPGAGSLLGYLLPASYPVTCTADAGALLDAMRQAFRDQVTGETVAAAARMGLTLGQVVTLASIVEREAVLKSEQPMIAAVFLNRLREGMPLQADPTVQFAIATPASVAQYGWWKRDLTVNDLASESPYNTYAHRDLPPGPIANPGIDAIRAVVRPAAVDYRYFVAKGDGSHVFARTLEEHNANVAKYRKP